MSSGAFIPTAKASDGNMAVLVTDDEHDGSQVVYFNGVLLGVEGAAQLRDWLDGWLQDHGPTVRSPADGVSMAEAARRVGVHYRTIRNWVQKGQLPATRFGPSGKIIRIDPADLARVRRPA